MRIFPESDYSIELNNDSILSISKLQDLTLSEKQFVTNWNSQVFIGNVKEREFEIRLSKKIPREFCVLKGRFDNRNGILEIRTGKILKIIFVMIMLFSLSGIIVAIIQNKLELIFNLVISIIVVRFIFLELGFRLVSKIAINKLIKVIGIKKIRHKKTP